MLHWIQSGRRHGRQRLAQTTTFIYQHALKRFEQESYAGRLYRRFRIALSVLLFFLLSSIALLAWPLLAAIELNYFDVFVAADMITLEWSTASEYNTAGFEVYCKEEDQPDSAFHLINQRIAQGGVGQGAIYRLDLTRDLVPGQTYCFRLREITTDDTIGEVLQLCGYGLNMTPTPQATPTSFGSATLTATVNFTATTLANTNGVSVINGITVTNIVTAGTETGVPSQVSPFDLTATSEALFAPPTLTPSPVGGVSPVETPVPLNPPPLPTLPGMITPGIDVTSTQNSLVPQTPINTENTAATNNLPSDIAYNTGVTTTNEPMPQTTIASADPPYIVLTATPAVAAPPILPTFTPYPTAVALANEQLMAAKLPTTQNLMLLLLCGIFSGASGLGILGLITTLLYMRSRSDEKTRNR